MRIRRFAWEDGEEKREISIVAVQEVETTEILNIVPRHRREEGIELVVGFGEEIPVGIGEDAGELADQAIDNGLFAVVENNGQREVAQRLTIAQGTEAVTQVFNVGL